MKKIAIILLLASYALCGYSQTWHYKSNTEVTRFQAEREQMKGQLAPPYGVSGQCLENTTQNTWENGEITKTVSFRKDNKATQFDENGNPVIGTGQNFVHTMSLFNFTINAKSKTITINNFGDKKSWVCVKEMNVVGNSLEPRQMWVFSTPPNSVESFDLPMKDFAVTNYPNGTSGIYCTDSSIQYKVGTTGRSASLSTYYQATDAYFKGGKVIYQ